LFGDAGMPIDAPDPSRWYLRIAPGMPLPAFPDPAAALGSDLGDALVDESVAAQGSLGGRPETRRWRALLSEAQVVLHNHPWNARRAAEGKPPVNSLWFWGGGALPDSAATALPSVHSGDAVLLGLASRAGIPALPLPARFDATGGDSLFDLRGIADFAPLAGDWLQPAAATVATRPLQLDFADGACFRMEAGQRWRFWRTPASRLA
jgi:hypothetical protein